MMPAPQLLADAQRVARETLTELERKLGVASVPVADDDVPLRIVALARRIAATEPQILTYLAGRVIAVAMQTGGRAMLDLGDWTSWVIVEQRGWEPLVTDVCLRGVKSGATVLDVGAHIGAHSIAYASRTGPTGRVFAFEPLPANLALLQHTIALNNIGAVVSAEPLALGDTVGTARLHGYAPDSATRYPAGSGMLHSLVPAGDYSGRAIDVPLTTLDAWSAERGIEHVDFLKIDVEGAELMVLRGARELLARSAKVKLVVELHPLELGVAGSSVGEVLDVLRSTGFSVYEPVRGRAGTADLAEVPTTPRGQHVLARR